MARTEDSHSSPTTTPGGFVPPEVGRPRGGAWKALQQEGIEVESQVQIIGDENDLAARLILTSKRLVLVAGGQIIVEFPRSWLRPQARLLAENGVRIFITPEGADVEGHDGEGAEQPVALAAPVPVYITYLTAMPEGSTIAYFKDVYGHDKAKLANLPSGSSLAAR